MPEITLAIEVSNPGADAPASLVGPAAPRSGVALGRRASPADPIECINVEWLHPRSRHDDALMPAIDALCRAANVAPGGIHRVAVSIGPGGYTSLRIGVTIAKLIAEATGAACVGVPTASAVLVNTGDALRPHRNCRVCLAWKRDSVWCQDFDKKGSDWHPVSSGGIVTLQHVLTGNFDAVVCEAGLRALLPAPLTATVLEPVFDPRGVLTASASLAPIDPLLLAPLYPREPEAVTKWRELHPR